jgi:hypothetical protein
MAGLTFFAALHQLQLSTFGQYPVLYSQSFGNELTGSRSFESD